MLSQAKMPPPLKKYRGKRGDVSYLPDFFFLSLWRRWGVCTQPRQKILCKKRANLRKAGSLLAREQGRLSRNLFYSVWYKNANSLAAWQVFGDTRDQGGRDLLSLK